MFALLGDELLAASPDFQALRDAHATLMSAAKSGDAAAQAAALAACREHAPPIAAALYDGLAAQLKFGRQIA